MSRSVKHHPFASSCGHSQQRDNRICNRIMRRRGHVALRMHGEDAVFLRHDEALDKWSMAHDGSRRYRIYDQYGWMEAYRWWRWVWAK